MVHPLIAVHAALGELAGFAFLWAFVESLGPSPERIKRAQLASVLGLVFVVASWLTGGYYYVSYYGANVKPIIKVGPTPWAHLIFMETKEHVFLFLPFLAATATALILTYGPRFHENASARKGFLVLAGLNVLMVLTVAAMGFIVTSGYREALVQAHVAGGSLAVIGMATAAVATRVEKSRGPLLKEKVPLWGFYAGAVAAMILVSILTVSGELNAGLKGWLKATFMHHWIGKGVLATFAFVVVLSLSAFVNRTYRPRVYRWSLLTFSAAAFLGAVLLIFYAIEYFL
ncbi:MAG: hypothetical protein ACE5HJ_04375 [Thermoplasmata archaeon]